MRLVIDINHPAHVHYFKNFIWEMEKKGHEILITASQKDISYKLLDSYRFDYIALGSYGRSLTKKILMLPIMDYLMYDAIKKFDPDLFLGFGSIRNSHVSRLIARPCIAMDDTEHAKYEQALYVPFTDAILTPSCFKKNFGNKHIRYNGYTELTYLHPRYFRPDPAILDDLGIARDETYVILRFVSWTANHDIGHHGLSLNLKRKLVEGLRRQCRVLITSEGELPADLEEYRARIPPEQLHNLLSYATLYIGEGATTASESAILGTYAVYTNPLRLGYLDEEEKKYGLVYNAGGLGETEIIDRALRLVADAGLKKDCLARRDRLIREKIDVTGFLIDYVNDRMAQTTGEDMR